MAQKEASDDLEGTCALADRFLGRNEWCAHSSTTNPNLVISHLVTSVSCDLARPTGRPHYSRSCALRTKHDTALVRTRNRQPTS